MARRFIALMAAAATIFSLGTPPQDGGAAPCPDIMTSLVDCLSYVELGSSLKRPSVSCCSSIANVFNGVPMPCICQVMETAKETGFMVNMTRSLQLPAACSLKAPNLQCQAAAPSHAPSPSPSSPSTPIAPSPSTPAPLSPSALAPTQSPSQSPSQSVWPSTPPAPSAVPPTTPAQWESPFSSPPAHESGAPGSSGTIVTPAPSPAHNLNAAPASVHSGMLAALLVAAGSALLLAH